MSHNCF
jgi:hypothetical protein